MKKKLFFAFGALLVAMLPTVDANAQGYTVTWKNWDYQGHDSVRVVNTSDNKIRPVQASPYIDTMILGWYVDAALTTTWNFLTDELTSDTTLWPRWEIRSAVQGVYHYTVNLQGFNDLAVYPIHGDTMTFLGTPGMSHVLHAPSLTGFTPVSDSIVITSMPATDTLVVFNYTRNRHKVTANLKGGHFDLRRKRMQHMVGAQRHSCISCHTLFRWQFKACFFDYVYLSIHSVITSSLLYIALYSLYSKGFGR